MLISFTAGGFSEPSKLSCQTNRSVNLELICNNDIFPGGPGRGSIDQSRRRGRSDWPRSKPPVLVTLGGRLGFLVVLFRDLRRIIFSWRGTKFHFLMSHNGPALRPGSGPDPECWEPWLGWFEQVSAPRRGTSDQQQSDQERSPTRLTSRVTPETATRDGETAESNSDEAFNYSCGGY